MIYKDLYGNKLTENEMYDKYELLSKIGFIKENSNEILYIKNGNPHRLDGPAIVNKDGSYSYYVDGKRHRLDGPAEYSNEESYCYWVNNKRHRLDGPAWLFAGKSYYYINGIELTKEQFEAISTYLIK